MNLLRAAFDNFNNTKPVQLGEKGHVEYGWSENIDETLCQLFFQLVRCKSYESLRSKLNGILTKTSNSKNVAEKYGTLSLLLKMAVNTY